MARSGGLRLGRRCVAGFIVVVVLGGLLAGCDPAPPVPVGSVVGPIGFEDPSYGSGSVGEQQGWRAAEPVDAEVVDTTAAPAAWELGDRALRVSNGAPGTLLSPSTADHSGEVTDGDVTGQRRGFFEASWTFASTDPDGEQEDLAIQVAPSRRDGVPMAAVALADCSVEENGAAPYCVADGLEVDLTERAADGLRTPAVATGLSRASAHTLRVRTWFFEGPANDVVQVCVDGTTCRTGGSLEDGAPVPVDSLAIQPAGTVVPEREGSGFLLDDVAFRATTFSGASVSLVPPNPVVEGAAGATATAISTVTLSEPLPFPVQVPYETVDGTAVAPTDYGATSGTATFQPGETAAAVAVPVVGDADDEVHETFSLRLGTPVARGLGPGPAVTQFAPLHVASRTITIRDDDSTLSIDGAAIDEPTSSSTPVPFTVRLANPSTVPVTVRFATADGSATAPADYGARTGTTVTLQPGQVAKTVNVSVNADTRVEEEERFEGRLSDPLGAVIRDATGTVVIRDSDGGDRPNLVFVMTDDQTLEQMRFLPRTRALLGGGGTTFTQNYVNFPLCCPARATYLTGQYAHNHGVRSNTEPEGGYHRLDHTNTLPVWLQAAGYTTVHVGKYMNGYGAGDPNERPPGWTEWYGLIDPSTYSMYDYKMNRNGAVTQYGHAPADYQTDVLADTAVDAIRRRAPQAAPFYLSVTPLSPHGEASGTVRAAPRHEGMYADLPLPHPPGFDEADVSDKPSFVQSLPRISAGQEATITTFYRDQAEALQSVDEMVDRMAAALDAAGELDDTVFVFTSDNGWFHGQHRVTGGKGRIYGEATHMPLLVRGPGFAPGAQVDDPVSNADIAPTFVALGGATARRVMDGRSLLDLDPARPLLVESRNAATRFTAVRTPQWTWVEYSNGERELFDIVHDPDELASRHADPSLAATRAELAALLGRLRTCAGATCRHP